MDQNQNAQAAVCSNIITVTYQIILLSRHRNVRFKLHETNLILQYIRYQKTQHLKPFWRGTEPLRTTVIAHFAGIEAGCVE